MHPLQPTLVRTRREFFTGMASGGLGLLALQALLAKDPPHPAGRLSNSSLANPLHPRPPHLASLVLQCGQARLGLPSLGSWLTYGLGTAGENLPGYVVLTGGRGTSGAATLWTSGFLSSSHAGVLVRTRGEAVPNLANPPGLARALRRAGLDALAELNRERAELVRDPEIDSRTASYELAFRMQSVAPELQDLSGESRRTLAMYGVDRAD